MPQPITITSFFGGKTLRDLLSLVLLLSQSSYKCYTFNQEKTEHQNTARLEHSPLQTTASVCYHLGTKTKRSANTQHSH